MENNYSHQMIWENIAFNDAFNDSFKVLKYNILNINLLNIKFLQWY